ncbi:MAG: helix-turn-helix domain-containing protein [Bacteroidales bacterium]|nr:helix-turn-helix domain-containing protein [Bacteroidales bacterium]
MLMLMCFGISLHAQSDTYDKLLSDFDNSTSVAAANRFFKQLDADEITDSLIVFKEGTSVDSLQGQVWYWASVVLYEMQQYKAAEKYGLKSLPLLREDENKADCLNLLGCIYVRLGDFNQAASYAKQCLDIDMQSGDDDRISSSLNTLAGIYMAAYQPAEAENYILKAIEHAEKANNPARKAVLMGMASEIYHALGNDENALKYAENAYQLEKQMGHEWQMAIRQSQKASALIGLHRYEEAETELNEVISTFKKTNDIHSLAIAYNKMGMSLLCQKREREAVGYYRDAAKIFVEMGDLMNEMHSRRGLYESLWAINPDSAKIELDRFDLLKDSLYTNATAENLARYNAEFENDQLQQEISQRRRQHVRDIILIFAIAIIVCLSAVIAIRVNQKRQQRRTEELTHEIELLKKMLGAENQETETKAEEELSGGDENDSNRQFLMNIIKAVNEGLPTGEFGVEAIASKLNMSEQTFRRRLQSATGETPKAYISAIQMEKASNLLLSNPDLPIIEVACQCGFNDASSFSHTFKRTYGISPSQYREIHASIS